MLCDNATGDPVQMDLGAAASELTLGVVAVNAETSRMLHSYAERPPQGEIYRLYTENCPFSLETFVSQVRTSGTFSVRVCLSALRVGLLLALLA